MPASVQSRPAPVAFGDLTMTSTAVAKRGHGASSTLFDLEKFYENITAREAYAAMVRIGLPPVMVSLIVHMYLGARCIVLAGYAGPVFFPTRAVIR